MRPPSPRLLLHCDAANSKFTLADAGDSWRQEFASLETALRYAEGIATGEIHLLFFNEVGKFSFKSRVSPLPIEWENPLRCPEVKSFELAV
jgi:hypothetical protein